MEHRIRDHGGNIDSARARFGGSDWIDLSTGINRVPYLVPNLPTEAWTALPTRSALARLELAARRNYGTCAPLVAVAGAQAAIQLIPRLTQPGVARVLAPTYNEHAAALRSAGWHVVEVATLAELAGCELAVVVNPNNPDGQIHTRDALVAVSRQVGRLVVDESFVDARPDLSLATVAGGERILVLRSFGKFYGLAGVRLGFVFGGESDVTSLAEMAGPWAVSGVGIEIGTVALSDAAWHHSTVRRLQADAERLDALAQVTGWSLVGGTELFRLYKTADATEAQDRLARRQIWTRAFPYSATWLRLGLPGTEGEWERLGAALRDGAHECSAHCRANANRPSTSR